MASILFSAVGAVAGGTLGGGMLASAGKLIGGIAGSYIDNALFGGSSSSHITGARLKDLQVITSTYGNMIPIIYGTVKIAGNIIWAAKLREVASSQTYKQRSKGARVSQTITQYSYFASFAVSICEGEIDEIVRIYANDKVLKPSIYNIRVYKGSEMQMPDPLIEAHMGFGKTPAYRSQAYVVFEEFPLEEFGNQIPNINFEVRRTVRSEEESFAEELISGVCLIPGSGEYVYDTQKQFKSIGHFQNGKFYQCGKARSINSHSRDGVDSVLAIESLKKTLPNVKWISVVVSWFGTSLNIADCNIYPAVEFRDTTTRISPDEWSVAGYNRMSAHLIKQVDGKPIFGGTVNDSSLKRYLKYLKAEGYNVMLYPMLFIDDYSKPWRGRVCGKSADVEHFFKGANGYNRFIKHYAQLSKGFVDGFIIGSEMKALTSIKNGVDYPAVDQFAELACDVKAIMGTECIITYAADWSEYHHDEGGYYHMDKLWASEGIDVIGIDAYFPLTYTSSSEYNIEKLMQSWESGECYDFSFSENRSVKNALHPSYAIKNVKWWWENEHINPCGTRTVWQPKSKKIWFTEYGFPSVDCSTNQPNVFYDGYSKESAYPVLSKGVVDYKAQRSAIIATEQYWKDSEMVEQLFLWSWDARPYPLWPDLGSVWSDYRSWRTGHWVQGKLGCSTLSGIIADLCKRACISEDLISIQNIADHLDGMVVESITEVRKLIASLARYYDFDILKQNGKILMKRADESDVKYIDYSDRLISSVSEVTIMPTFEVTSEYTLNYIDISNNYRVSNRISRLVGAQNQKQTVINLPIVMGEGQAQMIADRLLYNDNTKRVRINFSLSSAHLGIEAGDVLSISNALYKVESVYINADYSIGVDCISHHNITSYVQSSKSSCGYESEFGNLILEIIDIPLNSEYPILLFAGASTGDAWHDVNISYSTCANTEYTPLATIKEQATIGYLMSEVDETNPLLLDNYNVITISLLSGDLYSIAFDGDDKQNLAIIGNEIIQFTNAKQIGENLYEISGITRGLFGSECYMRHCIGERFVLLDGALAEAQFPKELAERELCLKSSVDYEELESIERVNIYCNSFRKLAPFYTGGYLIDRDYSYSFSSDKLECQAKCQFLIEDAAHLFAITDGDFIQANAISVASIDQNGQKGCKNILIHI